MTVLVAVPVTVTKTVVVGPGPKRGPPKGKGRRGGGPGGGGGGGGRGPLGGPQTRRGFQGHHLHIHSQIMLDITYSEMVLTGYARRTT